jgi:hypothetical protein
MKPLFKVGTKVTIKDIGHDNSSDYPYAFVSGMQKYKNQKFTITRIEKSSISGREFKYYPEFDGHIYYIEATGHWSWSSPMFQETYEL